MRTQKQLKEMYKGLRTGQTIYVSHAHREWYGKVQPYKVKSKIDGWAIRTSSGILIERSEIFTSKKEAIKKLIRTNRSYLREMFKELHSLEGKIEYLKNRINCIKRSITRSENKL